MKKLMLVTLAIFAASAQAKVSCTIIRSNTGEKIGSDVEVKMQDARARSQNNEVGVLLIDQKGVVSNLENDMPGDQVAKQLNGKVIIMVERTKYGYDSLKMTKAQGGKKDLDGIINPKAGNSAIGTLESSLGLGISLSSLDLMTLCKLSQ